ncbi:MAG: UMP kinase [Patescibacteria group bacterium]|nr:UMP kinase [Patescibacteria group bacterium]
MSKNKIIVLSLGGSLIIPKTGFDLKFLKGFKQMILGFIKKGMRFVIVCGGGATCRQYQAAAKGVGKMTAKDLDLIGIQTTRFNAFFIKTIFGKLAHPELTKAPEQKYSWKSKILVGAGWDPGWSSDYDAVALAKTYEAKTVINLSNIEYVYDSDPRKNSKAKKLVNISWPEFRKIVGNKWIPGANLPFDPIASKLAEKNKIKVVVMNGKNLPEVKKAIEGKKFRGTTIGA